MKAIAKDNLKYPEYPYTNWIKGNDYCCKENDDLLEIPDEQGTVFYFSGSVKENISQVFDIVE